MKPRILIYSSLGNVTEVKSALRKMVFDNIEIVNSIDQLTKREILPPVLLYILDGDENEILEMGRAIRENRENSEIPILFISNRNISFQPTIAGQKDFPTLSLVRPFTEASLLNSICLLARAKQQRDELIKKNIELDRAIQEIKSQSQIIETQKIQMIQQVKLAALGEMAGGIAHEINNPLMIMAGAISLLRRTWQKKSMNEETMAEVLGSMDGTLKRICKIIQGMKIVSRDTRDIFILDVELKNIIDDVLCLCAERLKNYGVILEIDLGPYNSDKLISTDPVQLGQVFLNLISNSFDAINGLEKRWIKIKATEINSCCVIAVIDSGNGISSDIQQRMFEPFFTSKEVGKGTGLGLSISRGIVESMGGVLEYDSNSDHTRFFIKLPNKIPKKMGKVG